MARSLSNQTSAMLVKPRFEKSWEVRQKFKSTVAPKPSSPIKGVKCRGVRVEATALQTARTQESALSAV